MNKEAVQRLREPAAWVLLVSAGLQLLAGLMALFVGGGGFTYRAFGETQSGFFTQVATVALLVLAVALVNWPAESGQARTITMGALGILGGIALFGVVCWLSAMLVSSEYAGAGSKLAVFLYGASKLAVVGVAGWFVFTVFQGMMPPRPKPAGQMPQGGYPDFGYQQGQPQQFGQQPQYGQPQEQQYQQYGQQFGQQGNPQGTQPAGYDQQQYAQQQYQQYGQPEQQYGQPEQQQYQASPQPGPAQEAEDESMGEWTRAYGGSGEPDPNQPGSTGTPHGLGQQGYGQQPRQGEGQQGEGGDWYRDNRPPQ
ncbi:hypothetical protein [Actinomadura macrotermitis]|uniref:Uncharacterized protein n=1 Tax=Actinomadura macrotermitis TaxID=2585200 RepID=A0A7K0C226_9ACTN|nr:hypothetical protein [Actinomadura macrotermitis]MQY07142.1 hypothetical protein [Actinomadura macrotermitis]